MNAAASSASAVTIDGRRNGAGTSSSSTARRADERLVDQGGAAGVHDVEEVGGQPAAASRRGLGAEVAHRVLEPPRPTVLGQPGDLAVEDEIATGQPGDE